MKIEKRDGTIEKRIIVGMVVNGIVLGRISARWDKNLFQSKWANLVSRWCYEYFKKYNKAPGKAVQGLYESWAADGKDDDTAKLVERFLEGISDEYRSLKKEINPEYIIDTAKTHFDKVRALRLADTIRGDIESGKLDKALLKIHKFADVSIGSTAGVDLFLDKEAMFDAFDVKADPLVVYPGALGQFFGSAISRDALISFMGPEKSGKTRWLMDLAWRGALQRRKVAFFEVGDLSMEETLMLFGARASRKPIEAGTINYPKLFEPMFPVSSVEHEERHFPDSLSKYDAWRGIQNTLKNKLKTKRSFLKVFCYPNTTISIQGIANVLRELELQDWTPDIVCIDYADILAPINGTADSRDQINATWKGMKSITQIFHCCVATATQSDANSYNVYTMNLDNFSEDKRKYAHVNGMIGINITDEEKELELTRLNWMLLRGAKFNRRRCIHCAGAWGLQNPALKTGWAVAPATESEPRRKKKKSED